MASILYVLMKLDLATRSNPHISARHVAAVEWFLSTKGLRSAPIVTCTPGSLPAMSKTPLNVRATDLGDHTRRYRFTDLTVPRCRQNVRTPPVSDAYSTSPGVYFVPLFLLSRHRSLPLSMSASVCSTCTRFQSIRGVLQRAHGFFRRHPGRLCRVGVGVAKRTSEREVPRGGQGTADRLVRTVVEGTAC